MIKENIALYNDSEPSRSLRDLPLKPDCDGRIEYLFFTLNIARDFDDLTQLLGRVLDCPFREMQRFDDRIYYELTTDGEPNYLQFKVKNA